MKAEAQVQGLLRALLGEAARRVADARKGMAALERRAARAQEPPDFGAALAAGPAVAVIAEIKRKSPSAGALWIAGDVAELAGRMEGAGAAALSVLTEPVHFGGSLDDLARAAAAVRVPVLRKDFILDPVQLYEARAAGAAAILLIARILEPARLAELAGLARNLGLATLVEVHDPAELKVALAAQPTAVGVNARDLDTLAMDRRVVEELLGSVPADRIAVAESGLSGRADVEAVAGRGADAVLVGAAIVGAPDPAAALGALTGVRRRPELRGRRGL
jgi:indole-3-glycerol phosphate synthase